MSKFFNTAFVKSEFFFMKVKIDFPKLFGIFLDSLIL